MGPGVQGQPVQHETLSENVWKDVCEMLLLSVLSCFCVMRLSLTMLTRSFLCKPGWTCSGPLALPPQCSDHSIYQMSTVIVAENYKCLLRGLF